MALVLMLAIAWPAQGYAQIYLNPTLTPYYGVGNYGYSTYNYNIGNSYYYSNNYYPQPRVYHHYSPGYYYGGGGHGYHSPKPSGPKDYSHFYSPGDSLAAPKWSDRSLGSPR
jgi:hypothetical protein